MTRHLAKTAIAGLLCVCSPAVANVAFSTVQVRAAVARCPGVFFLGARGSGETTFGGLGPSVARMSTVAGRFLRARHIAMTTEAVSYRADPVTELFPTSYEISLFKSHPKRAAKRYWTHNVEAYIASINGGITAAVSQTKAEIKACPHTLLILAGYSQGAMVMHQAELRLAADHETAVLRQIAATILLGDGDRVKDTAAMEYGTSSDTAEGIRTWLGHNSDQDVAFPATTANICNAGDIVCDFGIARVIHAKTSIAVHTSYAICDKSGTHCTSFSPLLGEAATWAAQLAAGRYDSTHWTVSHVPVPPGGSSAFLVQVACPSASSCLAAGIYQDSSGATQGLLDRLSDGTWTSSKAPLPANAGANPGVDLFYLACLTSTACVAAGDYQDAIGQQYPLIETWNGRVWTPTVPGLPADAGPHPTPQFTSIACPSATSCVAVGTYQDGAGSTEGLIESLSGGTWKAATAPLPADASGSSSQLESVACPSTSACVAVGSYQSTGSGGLIEVLSAGGWVPAEADLPSGVTSGSNANLVSVSCPVAVSCVAAGTYGTPESVLGLIEALNHGIWTPQTAQLPAGAAANAGVSLTKVACASSPSCVVVGSYMGLSGTNPSQLGLLETASDGGWSPVRAPLPPGAASDPNVVLASVACDSPGSCVAIGSYSGSSAEQDLIEILSGGAWTPTRAHLPSGAVAGGQAYWVSCAAAWLCVATASYQTTSGRSDGMIMAGPG